jgi:negative regulator of flagellin synthesis FlgM|tara:strand:- start:1095 stop:1487 length:393 start_codon:yes stop_codon:yes gene_type:complete
LRQVAQNQCSKCQIYANKLKDFSAGADKSISTVIECEEFPVKINGYQPPSSVTQSDSSRSQATQKSDGAKAGAANQADVVTHLSQLPQDASQDINSARVEELREAIRDGKLNMNTDNIAEALLKSLTDGL